MEVIKREELIPIWAPRYCTNSVLVATYKLSKGINYITFTKAKHLTGKVFKIATKTIKANNYSIQKNGNSNVVCIPMDALIEVKDFKII